MKFQPTHTHFALISKLQVALISLFNMVQIDFSVLFLFLAATVAPVAARPVNQPNPPHHHTPPARANSLPSSTPHHTPPAPPIPPTHHQTPPVVHQPNPGPDHQIHHAQNNPSVLYGMIDEYSF